MREKKLPILEHIQETSLLSFGGQNSAILKTRPISKQQQQNGTTMPKLPNKLEYQTKSRMLDNIYGFSTIIIQKKKSQSLFRKTALNQK